MGQATEEPRSDRASTPPKAGAPLQLALFVLALLLFSWPLSTIASRHGDLALAGWLFGGWLLTIVVLAALGRSLARRDG